MVSLIFQLRMGYAPLNDYLHQFMKVDSPRCPAYGTEKETAKHFILSCPKYAHKRWALTRNVQASTPKLMDILSDPKIILPLSYVVNYMEATGRLDITPRRTDNTEHS